MLSVGDTNHIIIIVIEMRFRVEFYVLASLDRKLRETNIRDEYKIIILYTNVVHYNIIIHKVLCRFLQ